MSSLRPPPLQWLPAFEAAARLLSFSQAAQELHVTTAAISQQIKQLEAHLGQALFQRLTRRVALTEAGQHFQQVATQTLSAYRLGFADFQHRFSRPQLRLSMTPLVAHEFLIPRLAAFQSAHPDVAINLDARMDLVDFQREPVDAAIRVGTGQWPGLNAWPLCECEAVVLAAPDLLARLPVASLDDLQHHTLIHPRQSQLDWHTVAQFAQVPRVPRKGDLVLDSDLAALHAAEKGLGIAICLLPAHTTGTALPSSRVVPVFPPMPVPFQAYFVFRPQSGKEPLLKEVFDWIQAQIANPAQMPNA